MKKEMMKTEHYICPSMMFVSVVDETSLMVGSVKQAPIRKAWTDEDVNADAVPTGSVDETHGTTDGSNGYFGF